MNFNLTNQFVRDYEEQRNLLEQMPDPADAAPPPEWAEENERLKRQVADLEEAARVLDRKLRDGGVKIRELEAMLRRQDEGHETRLKEARVALEAKDDELKGLRARWSGQAEQFKKLQGVELDRKESMIHQLTAELTQGREEVERLKAKLDGERAGGGDRKRMAHLWDARVKEMRRQIRADLAAKLERVAYLPLKTRLAALVFDAAALVIGVSYLRELEPAWTTLAKFSTCVVGALAVFSLRTFVSPGRILLGVSPGRSTRPTGPPARRARWPGSAAGSCITPR